MHPAVCSPHDVPHTNGTGAYLQAIADLRKERQTNQGGAPTNDRASRDALVEANLQLVIRIARRYAQPGYPLDDAIQDGNLGLLRAAEKFDPTHGAAFSTYATYWIEQAVQRGYHQHGRMIRLPSHVHQQLRAVEYPDEPPPAAHPNSPALADALSLCTLRADGAGIADLEFPDSQASDPAVAVCAAERAAALWTLVAQLPPRWALLLTLRYRYDCTREETGRHLGVGRKRVHVLEHQALSTLQSLANIAET